MRFLFAFLAVVTASTMLAPVLALAQAVVAVTPAPGAVEVPWGSWTSLALANLRDLLISGFVTLAGVLLAKFAPSLKAVFDTMRVEQLLTRAVDFGIASVSGAVKGKTATVSVANEVLEKALEYAVDAAPALASKISDTLRPKIIARIGAAGIVPIDATVGPVVDPSSPAVLGVMGASASSTVIGFTEAPLVGGI